MLEYLFKEVLEFDTVKVHTDLKKEQMREVLGSLKQKADDFEANKGEKDLLTIAVSNVGFNLQLTHYKEHIALLDKKRKEYSVAPRWNKEHGRYNQQYALTVEGQPICLAEYSFDLASGEKTHVLTIYDWDAEKPRRL